MIQTLLEKVKLIGGTLHLEGEEIHYAFPPGTFTSELRAELNAHKPEIISFLQQREPHAESFISGHIEEIELFGLCLLAEYLQSNLPLCHKCQRSFIDAQRELDRSIYWKHRETGKYYCLIYNDPGEHAEYSNGRYILYDSLANNTSNDQAHIEATGLNNCHPDSKTAWAEVPAAKKGAVNGH